jgi:hypothetical protein
MTDSFPASLAPLLLGLALGDSGPAGGNRLSLEGLSVQAAEAGAIMLCIRRLEGSALQMAMGELVLDIGGLVVHGLRARIDTTDGTLRLSSIDAEGAELTALRLKGPLQLPAPLRAAWQARRSRDIPAVAPASESPWSLEPLGTAEGTIRGRITDAQLLFDADVTVPLRQGQVDFNDATVEHVGPDSRMGVSRLGFYVDAPTGRSYLYQFASAPLAGLEFEQRGTLIGPWVSERGKLHLQAFAEAVLREGISAAGAGLAAQTRQLLERTTLAGQLQLGDGLAGGAGLRLRLEGRNSRHNVVELSSQAVSDGLTFRMAALSAGDLEATSPGARMGAEKLSARLEAELRFEGDVIHASLALADCRITRPSFARTPGA